MIYKKSNEELRKQADQYAASTYVVFDDGDGRKQNRITIIIRGNDVAIARNEKTWRISLREVSEVIRIMDGHFETIRDSVVQYADTHRDEIGREHVRTRKKANAKQRKDRRDI